MTNPDQFYTKAQRELQTKNETKNLANAAFGAIVRQELEEPHVEFIQRLDYFFLSSVNSRSEPTVSYKGGPVGFIKVIDAKTIMFPNYDGNGMFYSIGNIEETNKVGLLFIDMETPLRVRVQGTAHLSQDPDKIALYPGANMVVMISIDSVFYNCARYIHKFSRVETSKYIPDSGGNQPYPAWKRIDLIQGALHPNDIGRAQQEGGTITNEEYDQKIRDGDS